MAMVTCVAVVVLLLVIDAPFLSMPPPKMLLCADPCKSRTSWPRHAENTTHEAGAQWGRGVETLSPPALLRGLLLRDANVSGIVQKRRFLISFKTTVRCSKPRGREVNVEQQRSLSLERVCTRRPVRQTVSNENPVKVGLYEPLEGEMVGQRHVYDSQCSSVRPSALSHP